MRKLVVAVTIVCLVLVAVGGIVPSTAAGPPATLTAAYDCKITGWTPAIIAFQLASCQAGFWRFTNVRDF